MHEKLHCKKKQGLKIQLRQHVRNKHVHKKTQVKTMYALWPKGTKTKISETDGETSWINLTSFLCQQPALTSGGCWVLRWWQFSSAWMMTSPETNRLHWKPGFMQLLSEVGQPSKDAKWNLNLNKRRQNSKQQTITNSSNTFVSSHLSGWIQYLAWSANTGMQAIMNAYTRFVGEYKR